MGKSPEVKPHQTRLFIHVYTLRALKPQIHNSHMNVHSRIQVNGNWHMAVWIPLCRYLLLHLSKSRSSSWSELECNQLDVEKKKSL